MAGEVRPPGPGPAEGVAGPAGVATGPGEEAGDPEGGHLPRLTRGRLAVLALLLLIGLGFAFLWFFVTLMISRPQMGFPAPPPDADAVAFSVANPAGDTIAAWFYPGRAGAGAVLLCHGHGVDRGDFTHLFPVLRARGLALLTLDFRAHGQSSGTFTSIGEREWEDLAAVIEGAVARSLLPASQPLAAYGRSMGAATLANGARHLPRIDAFILESCFAELRQIAARDAKQALGIPDTRLIDLFFALAAWRTGYDYPGNRPVAAIGGVGSRPILLIHDALDPRAPTADFERLAQAVPHAQRLVIPNAGHVRGHRVASATFERAFLGFLASAGIPLAP